MIKELMLEIAKHPFRAKNGKQRLTKFETPKFKYVFNFSNRFSASIVIVFFLSWLPFHVQRLLSIFLLESDGNGGVLHTLFILVFYTSGIKS